MRKNSMELCTENKYLIIGNGRVAKHISHYFDFIGINYFSWNRQNHTIKDLILKKQQSNIAIFLIKDDAIADFCDMHFSDYQGHLIHFSGSLNLSNRDQQNLPRIYGYHPLMSFTNDLYDKNFYTQIPFVIEKNGPCFKEISPQLGNPYEKISYEKKALYHALCVMAGNFSTILCQKLFHDFEHTLGLSPHIAKYYLQKVFDNIVSSPNEALTGPLARKDLQTIKHNLNALKGDPYQKIYLAFVNVFLEIPEEELI